MWKIKKKTKVTLISQPDMWLAMILPGPGEAGLPRTLSLGERTIRQRREWGCDIAFLMPVASKGPLQLIHRHSCKGGGGWTTLLMLHGAKGQDRIAKMSPPKPPVGRRVRAQSGRRLAGRSPLCELSLARAGQLSLSTPAPSAHHPTRCPIPFMHSSNRSRILFFYLSIYSPMANMPQF